MRCLRLLTCVTLLLALAGPGAVRAEEPAAGPLTLADLYGGKRSFTKSIPDWKWRPGHAQLVRVERRSRMEASGASGRPIRRPPSRILVAMDPESGTVSDLLDLSALDALVPGKGTRLAGIGRAGPPDFEWSQDGRALCVVVKGDLVWVDLATGFRRRLTQTDSPMADVNVAPDGRHVSFSKANELWVVPTKEGAPYALTSDGSDTRLNATLDWLYPEELDFRTAAWWSPDGERIAYLQMDQSPVPRYRVPQVVPLRSEGREIFYPKAGDPNPRVRVGVVPVEGGKTRWVAEVPSTEGDYAAEYVVAVSWPLHSRSQASPWVTTADRTQRRQRTTGALGAPVDGSRTQGGWLGRPEVRHLAPDVWLRRWGSRPWRWSRWDVRKPPLGAEAQTWLTPKGVDASAVLHHDLETGRTVYQGTPLDGRTQGVFLGGPGCEDLVRAPFAQDPDVWTSASLDDSGRFALVTQQGATTPPRTVLARVEDGTVLRAIGDARAPALETVALARPEYGEIPVGDLGVIRWRLWKPADFDPKRRYGLIVHTYGGPGSRMVEDRWGRGPLLTTLLCQRGFLVLEADGRGTSGQSEAWMHSVYGRLGVLEIEDQASAVQAVLERGYVDPERVGIWGWSYGGTMACNALTMRGDVFKAGVAVAPVTDWRLYDSVYTERYMGLPKENAKGYEESSAIEHASKLEGHLLLLHGLGDDNVHAQNTLRLVEAFIQAKKTTYETMLYPKRGHGLGGAHLDVFTRLLDFFERHIGR